MIKNTQQLREELSANIDAIKKDPKFVRQAIEINNAAGKMINSARVELEYYDLRQEKPVIPFLAK